MRLPIRPMLAKLSEPSDALLARQGMAWEPKWDGYRMIAELRGDEPVRLWSRSGRLVTHEFPILATELGMCQGECVVDGEVVVMSDGRPSFNALQNAGSLRPEEIRSRMSLMLFDVLEVGGVMDVMREPYTTRRELLTTQIVPMIDSSMVDSTPSTDDGAGLWAAMELAKMEGMIGKPVGSLYRQNERGTWLKVKRKARGEYVVLGWTWGKQGVTGGRVGEIGALMLASRLDGRLVYAGKCGTGFDSKTLAEVKADLETIRAPFGQKMLEPAEMAKARRAIGPEEVVWVLPERIATVEYADTSDDGLPRFPAFKGMRRAD